MAIDTAAKRASISAVLNISPGYRPSGTIDAPARQAITYSYSGIAAGAPVVAVIVDDKRSLLIPLMSTMLVR